MLKIKDNVDLKELEKFGFEICKWDENLYRKEICSGRRGHFNLFKDNKVVMSFWSYTGKCYIPSNGFSDNIGIKNSIRKYKKLFGKEV